MDISLSSRSSFFCSVLSLTIASQEVTFPASSVTPEIDIMTGKTVPLF
jgi:hypothetical protein